MSKKCARAEIAYAILKPMKVGNRQRGFTIVETMIVLAVSGGLFLLAAVTVSGRQARQEFTQSIQDARSQIQQVVNEVATGYYPNMNNLSCSASVSGPVLSGTVAGQGENTGCISLGKVIQFGVAGTDPEAMNVYTVAGLQKNSGGTEVETLSDARPKVVAPSDSAPSTPNITESKKLLYGLRTRSMTDVQTGNAIGAFGIITTLAKYSDVGILSGSQQLKAYPISGSALNATAESTAQVVNTNLATSTPATTQGIEICMEGGNGQTGLITIGGNNRQLSVTLEIKTCS